MRYFTGRVLYHLRSMAAPYLVLLLALVLTLLAWLYVSANVEAQGRDRFEETVQAVQEVIERRTGDYNDAIYGARSLIYASDSVEPEEWVAYAEGIDPERNYSGLQVLGYAEYVSSEEKEEFLRKEGLQKMSPGGRRGAYFPVVHVGPRDDANSDMLGRDVYADPEHRSAIDRARDTGSPQATGMIYVLTPNTVPDSTAKLAFRKGFAVYLPVYLEGAPLSNAAERQRALRGVVFGYFWMGGKDEGGPQGEPQQQSNLEGRSADADRSGGLLRGVFGGTFDPGVDFEVYDGGQVENSQLLYDDDGVRRAGDGTKEALFADQSNIEVAGRQWTLYYATLDEFEQSIESTLPDFVRASGIAISLLLFVITWLLVRSRNRAEQVSQRLEDANRELEGTNKELEAFSYSVSHDLRAPLRSIDGFSRILVEDHASELDAEGRGYLRRVREASKHMGHLIDDLLDLSRVSRGPLRRRSVDLSVLVLGVVRELRQRDPERDVEFVIEEEVTAWADERLLLLVLENLLGNAWKFTGRAPKAVIEFGSEIGPTPDSSSERIYYVRDNGAGFDMSYADKLFGAFQRLHRAGEFEGTGIGLATVQRIIHRHGGRVWAEGEVGRGATFYFTLGGHRAETGGTKREKVKLA